MQRDAPQGEGQKQAPQLKMNLTKEEMYALQTCSRESFYYRCVPLGILFIGGTSILVNRGMIRGHPRFGALPKNMVAGLAAYVLGKVSYQGECRKKIMALENSPLAEAMKKGRRGRELITDMSTLPTFGSSYPSQETPDEDEAVKLSDSYSESNTQGLGLDDSKRPTLDGVHTPSSNDESKQPKYASYEELRQRNRSEFEQKQHSKLGSPETPQQYQKSPPPSPPSQGSFSGAPKRPVRTNQYGDVIED